MKVVRLIPEASLLIIFDTTTKQASLTQLDPSCVRRLAADCEEARLFLDPRPSFQVVLPPSDPSNS